jgi:cephalosporin hydroxylase
VSSADDPISSFLAEKARDIARQGADSDLSRLSLQWMLKTAPYKYTYHFTWMGRPIIQFPQDILAMQELIWNVKPECIIETGVAHGGSIIFHASMLQLLGGEGRVLGIDIDIRSHNRKEIEAHPMASRIDLLQGSSVDPEVMAKASAWAKGKRALLILDSNHTHEHVLAELRGYSHLVNKGGYIVVMDTTIEDTPPGFFPDRSWGPGNSPKSAVRAFMKESDRFEVDGGMDAKLLISVAREGFLRCIKDS